MRLLWRGSNDEISFTRDLSEDELPKYAILSHTWGDDDEEVTYKDVLAGVGTTKAGVGSTKIRFCIEQTKRDRLQYFWSDTCCIDKSDHVELNTALNSMFRWYEKAEKCYVYLADVSASERDTASAWEHDFRNSRWFTRGWTLQELIAPSIVEFYSCNGVRLGDRSSLEALVHASTGIPVRALRKYSPADFTISERQEWQQGRQTGKPEDMVYSLLGLLQVALPAIYGITKDEAQRQLDVQIAIKHRGARHAEFGLNLSIPGALETKNFVARIEELSEMRLNLTGSSECRRYVVLQGLGGIGKTQLALAYALRYKDDYSAVLWLDASSNSSVVSSFSKIARQILRAYPDTTRLATLDLEKDLDKVVDAVKAWLNTPMNTRWLLIYDNYDNPKLFGNADEAAVDIMQYLPEDYYGSVLITTRSLEVTLGHCMQVKKLDVQDGLKILEHSSRRGDLTADDGALAVAQRLDGLPLALATAGKFLSQNRWSWEKYLGHLDTSWAKLQLSSPRLRTYQDRTLFTTWQISFEQIEQRSSIAANLLRLWAYFDGRDLWFELLAFGTDNVPQWLKELTEDELNFEQHMRVLCNHGLVEANAQNVYEVESMGYSVHSCVHDWMVSVLNQNVDKDLANMAVRCIAWHEHTHFGTRTAPLIRRRLLPHAMRCAEYYISSEEDSLERDGSGIRLGHLFYGVGKFSEAERILLQALNYHERTAEASRGNMFRIMNSLATAYAIQGKLGQAEDFLMRALQGLQAIRGPEDAETLTVARNIGSMYVQQGKLDEAEKMLMTALNGFERAVGADDLSTLRTLRELGTLYVLQNKLEEAERMLTQVLTGYRKTLGADHTATLNTLLLIGYIYSLKGELTAAEEMISRSLSGFQKMLGADDNETLDAIIYLGKLRVEQSKIGEAMTLYQRANACYHKMPPELQRQVDRLKTMINEGNASTTYEPCQNDDT